ncbi:MAG: hypothetical protein ACOX6H_04230 [Christensenellales bacterium]|jgi:hypothetical protein
MKRPKVLLVYLGLGKTFTANIDNRVLEVRMSWFKNLKLKGTTIHPEDIKNKKIDFVPNPEFPKNMAMFFKRNLPGKIAVMALKPENLNFCTNYGYTYGFVLPSHSKMNEIKAHYISRGYNPDGVEKMLEERLKQAQEIINKSDAYVFTVNKGEYLINVLEKYIF